ncbi:MAG: energy transducer TonB, partial [Gammaproteobacteria bacterium]|nr:energy transducer TonB [Gammaproteobacteria bacterium]
VRAELNQARSAQLEDDVLLKANARLAEGMLLSPANDNARYYYELMLAGDPQNTAARQGLNVVASKLVLQARSEIDAGNLDAAEALLDDASEIDASNPELTAAATALAGAREAIVRREQRAAQEQRRIEEANRQAAIEKEAAERRLAEQAAAEAAAQTVDEPVADTVDAVPASADASVTTKEAAGTAAKPVVEPPATAKAQVSPATAGDMAPVSISSLTRTRYVAPKFPRTAQRRNQSGWVDVVFTVTMDGSVKDLEIKESTPEGVFDNAALRAVEKWEFEPVIENGVLVEKRAGVRMMFAIE